MKRINLLFLAAIFTIPSLAVAQSSSPTFTKGIRAGYQLSGMYRSGSQKFENLSTFYVGFFSESKVSDNWEAAQVLSIFKQDLPI